MEILVLGTDDVEVDSVSHRIDHEGHQVHRCAPSYFAARPGAACIGSVDPSACPLNGPLDAAVLVDTGSIPLGLESTGEGCAVRDHVPFAVVAPGSDPVAAAQDVVRARDETWSAALRALTGHPEVTCTSTRHGGTLHVTVSADVDPEDDETVGQLSIARLRRGAQPPSQRHHVGRRRHRRLRGTLTATASAAATSTSWRA